MLIGNAVMLAIISTGFQMIKPDDRFTRLEMDNRLLHDRIDSLNVVITRRNKELMDTLTHNLAPVKEQVAALVLFRCQNSSAEELVSLRLVRQCEEMGVMVRGITTIDKSRQ